VLHFRRDGIDRRRMRHSRDGYLTDSGEQPPLSDADANRHTDEFADRCADEHADRCADEHAGKREHRCEPRDSDVFELRGCLRADIHRNRNRVRRRVLGVVCEHGNRDRFAGIVESDVYGNGDRERTNDDHRRGWRREHRDGDRASDADVGRSERAH
jgi:hypothetical protein